MGKDHLPILRTEKKRGLCKSNVLCIFVYTDTLIHIRGLNPIRYHIPINQEAHKRGNISNLENKETLQIRKI